MYEKPHESIQLTEINSKGQNSFWAHGATHVQFVVKLANYSEGT